MARSIQSLIRNPKPLRQETTSNRSALRISALMDIGSLNLFKYPREKQRAGKEQTA
jgi:hypothetical protein